MQRLLSMLATIWRLARPYFSSEDSWAGRSLLAAVERTPGLRRDPPPYVRQRALADFYVEYQINACIEQPAERLPVLSALHANIQDLFNEHGVQIMSPHFESQPDRNVVVPKDRWYVPPASPPQGGA